MMMHLITDDFVFDFDPEKGYFTEFENPLPVYYYEAGEIMNQWNDFGRFKGVSAEQRKLSQEEADRLMVLFHPWKTLFGYSTSHSLRYSDMDDMLHIHHFDLLLKLYFNYKFRNVRFTAPYLD